MRILTDHELNLVAGGTSSSDGDYYSQTVYVFGHRVNNDWIDLSFYYTEIGNGGGGDPTLAPDHQQTETANDTPCVNQLPAGMDSAGLHHLNDMVKYLSTEISALQDSTHNEWGAFVYRMPDGQLYESDPFTAGHQNDLNGAVTSLPTGAIIVGYVHTHPIDPDSDQRFLSDDDRTFIDTLISSGRADTNMLAYVATKDKDLGYADNYSTYVFDKSERHASTLGCHI